MQMNSKREVDLPRQTVIIPVRNEERFIAATIGFIQNQDYPRDKVEIIVVDGHSEDRTTAIVQEIASRDPRVKLLHNPKRLSSAARNVGAQAATGDIVTYVDGHTFIDSKQLLRDIARHMAQNGVSVLSRPQFLDTPGNSFFQQAVALARRSKLGHALDSTIYLDQDGFVAPTSSGASYRREVFERVGYFDESFDAAEDFEFNYRAHKSGYASFTSRQLAVYYYPRPDFRGLFTQMKRYGIGRFRFFLKHKAGLGSGTLVPALMVAGLPVTLLLSLFSNVFLVPLVVCVALYLTIDIISSLLVAAKHGWAYLRLLPFMYPIIHCALGWGFVSEALKIALYYNSPRTA
jgi:GT2 family glycosyltransferase